MVELLITWSVLILLLLWFQGPDFVPDVMTLYTECIGLVFVLFYCVVVTWAQDVYKLSGKPDGGYYVQMDIGKVW